MAALENDFFIDHKGESTTFQETEQDHRDGSFDSHLDATVFLIKSLARYKSLEYATELSRLSETIKRSMSFRSHRWLLPMIKTALGTRIEALAELLCGDLEACLDEFANNLKVLNSRRSIESFIGLQRLRERIQKTGEGYASRWLLGSIDAVIGKEIIFYP
jgi:hypothetical protein